MNALIRAGIVLIMMSKINKILQLMELVKKHSYVKKIKRKIRNNTQKCAIKLNFPQHHSLSPLLLFTVVYNF